MANEYRYYILDVFTSAPFGGNQLAVLPNAEGLETATMQAIAREFNFSETTFVLAPQTDSNTRQVRIFTPTKEIPFAGHPNIGTAFALLQNGDLEFVGDPDSDGSLMRLLFEEQAGVVPILVGGQSGLPSYAQLTAPKPFEVQGTFDAVRLADSLSLAPEEIRVDGHAPTVASTGVAFTCVELSSWEALRRAQLKDDGPPFRGDSVGIYVYTRDTQSEAIDLRSRMFAPTYGVPEDPATGSAATVIAGLLAHSDPARLKEDGTHTWRILQGEEMGRPSQLLASATTESGTVVSTGVGGRAVTVATGKLIV